MSVADAPCVVRPQAAGGGGIDALDRGMDQGGGFVAVSAAAYRFRDNLPVMKTITIDTALMQMMAAS